MARKMKDSGIEWIGEIPEGWEITKIKHIVSSVTDIDHFMPDSAEFGIPYLMIGDLKDLSSSIDWDSSKKISIEDYKKLSIKSRPQIGDIIFARYASIGTTCYIDTDRDFLVSYACLTIHPSDLIIGKFLSYYLKSSSFAEDVLRRTNSNTQGNVGKDSLVNATIVLPSIIDQTQIVNFLDAKCSDINAMLSKTRSSIEEYKKLKQAVITQAVTRGVRGEREMKNCNIGWIKELPSDWGIIPSKYLFKNSDTKKINSDEQLTASQQHGIITQKYYTELTGSKVVLANKGLDDWKHVEPFDFIISLRSFQGGLEMSETTGCITWHYIVLKPCRQIYSYYYKWLFKSEIYIRALQRTCNFIRDGQDLRYFNFVQVPLFEPPLEEQKEIADYLNSKCAEIDKLIAKKEQLVKELESYKKSLIYEVVTGKREV